MKIYCYYYRHVECVDGVQSVRMKDYICISNGVCSWYVHRLYRVVETCTVCTAQSVGVSYIM